MIVLESISETKRLASTLRLWSLILSPQIRQSEARWWTWISIILIPWKEKRQRRVLMRNKLINNMALPCLRETREWNMCFGPGNSKIVYQNSRYGCLPSPNSIWYDNRGKITRMNSSKIFESKKIKIEIYIPWKTAKIPPTSRCLKEEIRHKMCWHFSRHFRYGFRYAALLNKLSMPHEKSSKYAQEPRNSKLWSFW